MGNVISLQNQSYWESYFQKMEKIELLHELSFLMNSRGIEDNYYNYDKNKAMALLKTIYNSAQTFELKEACKRSYKFYSQL